MNLPQREILIQPWQPQPMAEAQTAPYSPEEAASVQRFHRSMPGYEPTPLYSLRALAELMGLKAIYVKDESPRFGLNAFKGLGGSWAAARWVAERLGLEGEQLDFAALTSPAVRERLQGLALVTTTDGNHGRGIAWVARQRWACPPLYTCLTAPRRSGGQHPRPGRAGGGDSTTMILCAWLPAPRRRWMAC